MLVVTRSGVSELLQSLDEINWDLKMAEQPFDGLDGLLVYLGSQRLEFGKATGVRNCGKNSSCDNNGRF